MSVRAAQGSGTAVRCLFMLIIIYLVIGLVVYAASYGEPHGFSLTFFLVVILWPGALIWWSLYGIVWAIAGILMFLTHIVTLACSFLIEQRVSGYRNIVMALHGWRSLCFGDRGLGATGAR